ncbi:MAG TPA: ATP-binding protein [Pirellulales bacterium]|nr:ATP-binding protein [Pirellulales bacterium]
MANELKISWIWPLFALGVAAGVAWLGDGSSSWPARFGLAAVGVLTAGGPAWACWRRSLAQQQSVRRWLQQFHRLETRDFQDAASEPSPPAGNWSKPWHGAMDDLLRLRAQLSEQLAEAEHARAALELRARRASEQAERALGILRSLPEPVIAVDAYDALLLANASAEQLFAIEPSNGRRAITDFVRSEPLLASLNEVRRHQAPMSRTQELELDAPDGTRRWFSVTTNAMVSDGAADGRGAVAVLRDISARKANQRQNAEFVSAASHEMKTPLAGIKAYVELLADGDAEDEETREEFLDVINGQADRLQRLIDNLLNIARIEAGVVKVSKQSQPLNEILSEAHRVVQPAAEAKQIRLVHDLSPLYLGVLVDRDMMLQAAINLLSNAVKYTPPGGQVTLRSRLLDGEVSFEVQDTGVGLSPEDCQRVFDKFYRVDKDKQMAQGTGLGLPLAKYIVEDVHNGRLSVESRLGEGSTFQIRLPGAGQLG